MNGRKKQAGKPKKKRRTPSYRPYRSALEKRIAKKISEGYQYEPKGVFIDYKMPHRYKPDFVHPKQPNILIEVKGYFRTSSEASKYVCIKRDNPEKEIVFIFNNSFKKAHSNCRPRKDGTVLTLQEWCSKNGFLYYDERDIPQEIIKGTISMSWIKRQKKKRGIA